MSHQCAAQPGLSSSSSSTRYTQLVGLLQLDNWPFSKNVVVPGSLHEARFMADSASCHNIPCLAVSFPMSPYAAHK